MSQSCDILVIVAHPDDAEFGAAGSVARWVNEGRSVAYLVCTRGEKGSSDAHLPPDQLASIREKEQRAAACILGVKQVDFLDIPDQGIEDTPAFRREMVCVLRRYRPRTVITSDPYRRYVWHRDHRVLGQVVMDAVFPYARDYWAYPELIDQGLLPHKVTEILFWGAENINHRVDITPTFAKKLQALRCHQSQMKQLPVKDLEKWLYNRCHQMADPTDFELAEGFHREVLPA